MTCLSLWRLRRLRQMHVVSETNRVESSRRASAADWKEGPWRTAINIANFRSRRFRPGHPQRFFKTSVGLEHQVQPKQCKLKGAKSTVPPEWLCIELEHQVRPKRCIKVQKRGQVSLVDIVSREQ
jgi:hypothetical protein